MTQTHTTQFTVTPMGAPGAEDLSPPRDDAARGIWTVTTKPRHSIP